MKRIPFCLLILLAGVFNLATAQQIEFTRENVTISLDTGHVTVISEIYLKNPSGGTTGKLVFFPMPLRNSGMKRDTIELVDVTDNTVIRSIKKNPAGIFFMANFSPNEQKKYRITYTDDHNGHEIKYLVMTNVQYWSDPIPLANYFLTFNENLFTVDSASFVPDKINTENGITTESWKKTNFKPDQELTIYFHKD
jgi:hypothetical protein